MLYICIPAYNEAPTIGVLLWRIRKVFQGFPREYELLVYNDGSSDATGDTLAPYAEVLPLTILGGPDRVGYARALDALLRAATDKCRYVRRDAIITMQADFTDQPEHLPEIIRRFEGGADIVVAECADTSGGPRAVKRLRRIAPWLIKPSLTVNGVQDHFGSYRLFRVATVRDAIRSAGEKPLVSGEGWAANLDLLMTLSRYARRIETVPAVPRYELRPRESRIRPLADGFQLYRFARRRRVVELPSSEAVGAERGAARRSRSRRGPGE